MQAYENIAREHMNQLCNAIDNRCVGSPGNILATEYFEDQLKNHGWQIERQSFDAFYWIDHGSTLTIGNEKLTVKSSPYSLPCDISASHLLASNISDLKSINARDKILCLKDELSLEPLMPKSFVFYNPDKHKQIVSLLEKSGAKAIVCISNKKGTTEGGEFPFPIIEDGDFNIPSVFVEEAIESKLLLQKDQSVGLEIKTERIPSEGYNIVGRRGNVSDKRIVITAHIDAKKGTPGAIDNATGITTLLLLSELMKNYEGPYCLELTALNGEDYYSVPGQMKYLECNKGRFSDIALNINIDGVGLEEGETSISLFNLNSNFEKATNAVVKAYDGIVKGEPWYQGDHSIFLQQGVPAIAISSKWLLDNLESQDITHTPKDNSSIVNHAKLVQLAIAIAEIIQRSDKD